MIRHFAVAGGLAAALSAPAVAERLVCDITSVSRDLAPRIGEEIVIDFSQDSGIGRIDDGFPKPEDLPHRARISKDTDTLLSFVWKQPGLLQTGYMIPLAIRMTVGKSSGQASLTATTGRVRGADLLLSARAHCRLESK